MKDKFFTNHAKSSAMFISIGVHLILIAIAVGFVVVSVIPSREVEFKTKDVKRPKMPIKKIQVPVDTKKRKPKPRLRKRILSKKKSFTEIRMPEITGVSGGLGNMGGDGFGLGFALELDEWGSNQSMGNELVGTFYDTKQTKDGKSTKMTDEKYFDIVRDFARSFNLSKLDKYYRAPKYKYSTMFALPLMPATKAPEVFGAENVQPVHWICYYKGTIAAPETGRYRFWGIADNIMIIRVKNRMVIDACDRPLFTNWKSEDPLSGKFPMVKQQLVVGDWMKLKKGEPVEMELILGEFGGLFHAYLLIEQEGKQYKKVGDRPVLPIFKTAPVPKQLVSKIKLDPNKATLDGPTFGVLEQK